MKIDENYAKEVKVFMEEFRMKVLKSTEKELSTMYDEIKDILKLHLKYSSSMPNENLVKDCNDKIFYITEEMKKRIINVNSLRYEMKRRKERQELEKEYARIGREVIVWLDSLENKFEGIKKDIDIEKMTKGYDSINFKIERLYSQMSNISNSNHS